MKWRSRRLIITLQEYTDRLFEELKDKVKFWRTYLKIKKSGIFISDFYITKYPQVLDTGLKPLEHYILHGTEYGYDPGPLFCTKTYRINFNKNLENENLLIDFLKMNIDACPGAYKTDDVFKNVQKKYYHKIKIDHFEDRRKQDRPWTVFLQSGPGSLHRQWLPSDTKRPWDLIVNQYQKIDTADMGADIEILQTGSTKSTGFYQFGREYPEIVDRYDYTLLLDDDIVTTEADITRLFEIVTEHSFDMAQASLTEDSNLSWPVFQTKGDGYRLVNMVEIMMPMISKRALKIMKPLFGQSVSGWGIDFVGSHLVRKAFGEQVAVIDSVSMRHAKQIRIVDSAFYKMLYNACICPIVELRMLKKKFGVNHKTEAIEI